MKALITILLTLLLIGSTAVPAQALPPPPVRSPGDFLGNVLNTDIRVFIDGRQILGYNIDGWTFVVAEDLRAFGFTVVWNAVARSLSVTRGMAIGTPRAVPANLAPVGSVAFPYVYTDIVTYIDGRRVTSYNIQGYTVVQIDDLAEAFGRLDWDPVGRVVRVTTDGVRPTTPTPPPIPTPTPTPSPTPTPAPVQIPRSAIVLPNRRLNTAEMSQWVSEYQALGGPNALELEIIRLVNEERARVGATPLIANPQLMTAARFKSQSMSDLDYMAHTGIYGSPSDLAAVFGFTGNIGQNLFRTPSTAADAMRGWMDSADHRSNIVNTGFMYVGIGVHRNAAGTLSWTAMFSAAPTATPTPTPAPGQPSLNFMSAGGSHSFAIDQNNALWGFGENGFGQLGDGTTTARPRPVNIMDNVAHVAAGSSHTIVVRTDGSLWGFGFNAQGQLGDGSTTNRHTPVRIMENVEMVAVGGSHTLALRTDGTLWAWGNNMSGELGDGTTTNRNTPVQVLDNVVYVAAGSAHTMAIRTDGSLWTWGANGSGQLGDGTTMSRSWPERLMNDIIAVAGGTSHTLAIRNDWSLWAFGDNTHGQLGDASTTRRLVPVRVLENIVAVTTRTNHSMAIRNDGTLWTWGSNNYGQLGDGTSTGRPNPLMILDNVLSVTAGNGHSMALRNDASLWTWGANDLFQLGDGTTTNRHTPVRIRGSIRVPSSIW